MSSVNLRKVTLGASIDRVVWFNGVYPAVRFPVVYFDFAQYDDGTQRDSGAQDDAMSCRFAIYSIAV